MIVSNNGYLKLNDVLELKNKGTDFSIYETHKKTNVLVTECFIVLNQIEYLTKMLKVNLSQVVKRYLILELIA